MTIKRKRVLVHESPAIDKDGNIIVTIPLPGKWPVAATTIRRPVGVIHYINDKRKGK